jgi:hypothetical protein
MVENQSGTTLKILQTDNAKEFTGTNTITLFLENAGVIHQTTTGYSSSSNGVAKCLNRTLFNMVRSMILTSKLPATFWAEAIDTANKIRNRLPSRSLQNNIAPYEAWFSSSPNITHLRQFGCIAYARIPTTVITPGNKIAPRAIECCFLGYIGNTIYRLWNPANKQIVVSRDVTFKENHFLDAKHFINIPQSTITPLDDILDDEDRDPQEFNNPIHPAPPQYLPTSTTSPSTTSPSNSSSSTSSPPYITALIPGPPNVNIFNHNPSSPTSSSPPSPSSSRSSSPLHYHRFSHSLTPPTPPSLPSPSLSSIFTVTLYKHSFTAYKSAFPSYKHSVTLYKNLQTRRYPLQIFRYLLQIHLYYLQIHHCHLHKTPKLLPILHYQQTSTSKSYAEADVENNKAKEPLRLPPEQKHVPSFEPPVEPHTLDEALNGPDSSKWHDAIVSEMNSHLKNGTFRIVPRPKNSTVVGTKFVFKIKDSETSNPRFKGRFIAQGFDQMAGLDYSDTYASVVRILCRRILLAIAASYNLHTYHFDVETAFLNPTIDREIFVEQPREPYNTHPREQ